MKDISQRSVVESQYKTTENLTVRMSIHERYSTNKTGFGGWIVSHYDIPEHANILELGCGTGEIWKSKWAILGDHAQLILSDVSEGMVRAAKEMLGEHDRVEYQIIDIESIPYENGTFQRVIANMMLYHVSDLDRGLSEVARVLDDGGYFYCATYGENGIVPFLTALLTGSKADTMNRNFTLQNGHAILSKYFSDVKRLDYADSLAVTDTEDLLDYIDSLSTMTEIAEMDREHVKAILDRNMVDGVLHIPKEYGMFICRK